MRPYFLGFLAEAHAAAGQTEEALSVLSRALDTVRSTEERWWEAELLRLRGDLLLTAGGNESDAEASLHGALAIARRQETKALELRAAMSLARLYRNRGKRDDARKLLAEVYGWFTEGFDTPDLTDARAFLVELST